MTDAELAKWLGIAGTNECDAIMAKITPEKRAQYEAFAVKVDEIMLYDAGLGPLPPGVIACGPKQIRHGARRDGRLHRKRRSSERK